MYITENGVSSRTDSLQDDDRIKYYKSYVNEVLKGKCYRRNDSSKFKKKLRKWLVFNRLFPVKEIFV